MNVISSPRNELTTLTSQGKIAARKLVHAQMLLHADEASLGEALKDADIAKAIHTSRLTLERVRKRFVLEGVDSALSLKFRHTENRRN